MIQAKNPTVAINSIGKKQNNIGRPYRVDTTYNVGDLVPLFAMHILPKDKITMNISSLVRTSSPPVEPTMDYLVHDTYAFFYSNYNIYEDVNDFDGADTTPIDFQLGSNPWTRFNGENPQGEFIQTAMTSLSRPLPTVSFEYPPGDTFQVTQTSLEEYLGNVTTSVSSFNTQFIDSKYITYRAIWNEYFRDWNLQAPMNLHTFTDYQNQRLRRSMGAHLRFQHNATRRMPLGLATGQIDLENAQNKINSLLPVNRLDDYFSRGVTSPQKFQGVISHSDAGLPIFSSDDYGVRLNRWGQNLPGTLGFVRGELTSTPWGTTVSQMDKITAVPTAATDYEVPVFANYPVGNNTTMTQSSGTLQANPIQGGMSISGSGASSNQYTNFANLYAGRINMEWINELERCYMLYNLYEINSRSPLYRDIIRNHFGVTPSNISLNRPIFLGKIRNKITATQVENVGEESNLGSLGAFTKKIEDRTHLFTKDFDDYGVLMILTCVRPHRSYIQFTRQEDFKYYGEDYHKPVLNNLPYQPTWKAELAGAATGLNPSTRPNASKFNWRPAWDEHQFFPDLKTGLFASYYNANSLDYWHYADNYDTSPPMAINFDSYWLVQGPAEVDRTLSLKHTAIHQILHESLITISGRRPISFHPHKSGRVF